MGFWNGVDLRWMVLSHKNCHPTLFYAWRIFFGLYVGISFILYDQAFDEGQRFPVNLKYLTVWCGLFVAFCGVALIVYHFLTGWGSNVNGYFNNLGTCGTAVARIVYVVYELGTTLQLLVPPLYWIGEYPSLPDDEKPVGYDFFLELNLHGIFTVLIAIDYLSSQIDVIKSHILFQQIFTIGYIIFNWWYTSNFGPIYSIITWDNVFTYVFILIALLFSILGFYLCAFLGGALVLMLVRSTVMTLNATDPVPGWEEELIFMAFIAGAGVTFYFFCEQVAFMKDKDHHLPGGGNNSEEEGGNSSNETGEQGGSQEGLLAVELGSMENTKAQPYRPLNVPKYSLLH